VLGIGPLWQEDGLVTETVDADGTVNCTYTGIHARMEYEAISGCPSVPLELDGDAGTRCKQ